jgi:hypothetical protein
VRARVEAEHIELRLNLLQACADERQAFCRNVQARSGRVFRCVCGSEGVWERGGGSESAGVGLRGCESEGGGGAQRAEAQPAQGLR